MNIEKIYNRFKKLTKEQKKIIYIGAVALVFLLFFWLFIYGPQSRSFTAIKKKLFQTEAEITEILNITQSKDLTLAMKELNSNLVKLTNQLPAEEGTVISYLSQNAKKLKLEVKNIIPSGKKQLENKISGYDIKELPISMKLAADFRNLGEYLYTLRNKFPVLVRIRELEIKGKGEGRTDLDIVLHISAYLSKNK